jgi:murein DD-endopeptidase MepM/ murein hydrolase activator NlpD
MSNENKAEKSRMEKLKHNYRLVIMNNETFEEIGSYQLSLLNVYIMISFVVVLVAILVGSIIVFTPIKTYIPGYGDVSAHEEVLKLNKDLDELILIVDAQKKYNDNIRSILQGEVTETEEDAEAAATIPLDSLTNVDRIIEDDLLRQEIELDQQIQERELLSKTVSYSPNDIPLEQMYFIPPATGVVSKNFAPDNKHYGIDILAPQNTPVKVVMDGFVIVADWTLETGNTIGVQHSNNLISFYKHNSALLKKAGSYVKAGEAIAIIGNSGELSSGPHLHFELWHKGKPLNPADYIIFE